MVVLDEYKFKLGELSKTLEQANAQMRPEELQTELKGLEDQMSAADFWNDVDAANKVTQRVKSIKGKLERLDKLNGNREDIQTLIEMAEEEDDESIIEEIKTELDELDKKVSALRLEMLLKGRVHRAGGSAVKLEQGFGQRAIVHAFGQEQGTQHVGIAAFGHEFFHIALVQVHTSLV